MSDVVWSPLPSGAHAAVLDASVIAELRDLAESVGEGFLAELATLFITDASARISDLHDAVAADDAPAAFAAAHTLAGSSSNLGASDLAALCARLADVCRSGELGGARSRLELIDREFQRVEPAIRELIESP
jgi:HPt (histidine-containing phosphotransfer) domain-containing protein